jgi:hypothetical protein
MAMKINQWKAILVASSLITIGFQKSGEAQQKFDLSVFYKVMASGDTNTINNERNVLAGSSLNNKEGYDGALLMKKSGMIARPKEKLRIFKVGRNKMETALRADSLNVEFRFLRLVIEEHAPKIVKYSSHIEKDKSFIKDNFKTLSPVVQHAVLDYCKISKVLHTEDF